MTTRTLILLLFCALVQLALGFTIPHRLRPSPHLVSRNCGNVSNATTLYMASNDATHDHYYTTDYDDWLFHVRHMDYVFTSKLGRVFQDPQPCTTPLYGLFSASGPRHFYTTSAEERDLIVSAYGYQDDRVLGHIYPEKPAPKCGAVPLYRLYNEHLDDYFWTGDVAQRDEWIEFYGWRDDGIAGYILPLPTS